MNQGVGTSPKAGRLIDLATVGGDLPPLSDQVEERNLLRMRELGSKLMEGVLTEGEQTEYEGLLRRGTGGGHLIPTRPL